MNKRTLVIGASVNPERYAHRAVVSLTQRGHEVIAVGLREGDIAGIPIQTGMPAAEGIDTVTLYVGPAHQPAYYDYIVELAPQRVIFNPGTENPELLSLLETKGIETVIGCTLVMLSINNY